MVRWLVEILHVIIKYDKSTWNIQIEIDQSISSCWKVNNDAKVVDKFQKGYKYKFWWKTI